MKVNYMRPRVNVVRCSFWLLAILRPCSIVFVCVLCFFLVPSVQPEMVVSINDAVEAVLPVPCPAHRVVRVAFLEPADHVLISLIFFLFMFINFIIFIDGDGGVS